jgi:3',5'-cyclic AMP phosphodiesterase CpdA
MLIAQITDIHLGFEPDNPAEFNRQRLDRIIGKLATMSPAPDLLICSGDLTDKGDETSYRHLKEALSRLSCETYLCMGNHDDRANFLKHFPTTPSSGGFIHYAVDKEEFVLVVLDTLEPGLHGGAFCEARATWLENTLNHYGERPILIVLHHPPVQHGIEWMDADPDADWIKRLAEVLRGRRNIKAMLAGHAHRSFTTSFEGHVLSVTASSAPQVALELAPMDPSVPDGRPLIVAEEPGYTLHHWTGNALVSFFEDAGDYDTLARYDAGLQGFVQDMLSHK